MRIFILIMSLSIPLFMQAQDVLDNRLNRPLLDCETIAFNSQELIAEFNIIQSDTILAVLKKWEAACGSSEPLQRVRILLAISGGYFNAPDFKSYYKYPLYYYKTRDRVWRDSTIDSKNEYQRLRSYFDHVPIGGALDTWSNSLAKKLLKSLDPKSDAHLLCLLFSEGESAFEEEIQKRNKQTSYIKKVVYDQAYTYWNHGMTITLAGGTWIPFNNQETDFGISPQLGIAFGMSFKEKWLLQAGASIKFWTDRNDIIVNFENIDSTTSSSSSAFIGLVLNRTFPVKEKFFIEPNVGVGVEILNTDIEEDQDSDDDSSFTIETVNFTFGTNFRMKVGKKSSIGINISYHYTPHNFDKDLITEVNPHALSTNLIYRF